MSASFNETPLGYQRHSYEPQQPPLLQDITHICWEAFKGDLCVPQDVVSLFPRSHEQPFLRGISCVKTPSRKRKPLRVGVVFSGGPAPGGHNVIIGIHEAIKQWDPGSLLFGFLDGPDGVLSGNYKQLEASDLVAYRNTGGFDLLGSGRAKVETEQQLGIVLNVVTTMQLDGLVVIGGDDSNTNAAVLTEYFLEKGCPTRVVGVPKTIDGDLKNAYVGTSFGFDTACKTYSELISNISRDALSSKKYYHFIRLMGRSASHIALECALTTQPNLAWIGEEIAEEKRSLASLVKELVDLIYARMKLGKKFGVVLIPEGLIEWIPEIGLLIQELNALLSKNPSLSPEQAMPQLSPASSACFALLPKEIQQQLLMHRDPHGNVQVSLIETEKLFADLVAKQIQNRQVPFACIHHFLGYEGRAGYPSNFDSAYCLALGKIAASLVADGKSGYMACVRRLTEPFSKWEIAALPLVALMQMEIRKGLKKPVIKKAFVRREDPAFVHFKKERDAHRLEDHYLYVGPIQFQGDPALTDAVPLSLRLDQECG